jgi:dTDP-4-amino-4,6-dideoxygalactose transaminase
MNKTLSSWPFYDQDEIDAALRVLSSGKVNYWTGNEGKAFENEFSSWVDVKHSISLANGTVALELALNAIDICPGDEIIVTPRTFIASISSVINSGAIPVFADVDKNTQNITAETILDVMTNNTKAIVCVHLGG